MTLTPEQQAWIDADPDPDARAELAALSAAELETRFAAPLAFGTAGLRGPLRAGPAGMNLATVIRATAGLAAYLDSPGTTVVVGRDARHRSEEFARATAEVLAGAGHNVVLLPCPLPTPIVAFAVLRLKAAAGVQITASHNPASDNGYKVYLSDGAQLVSPADRLIEAAIARVGPADQVSRVPVKPADETLVQEYLRATVALVGAARPLRIALTPLHGVGGQPLLDALAAAGYEDLHVVADQFAPDPDFPTVAFPNPEEPGACDRLLALAAQIDADIAIALDPDADRCAVGIPDRADSGSAWRMLRGDEVGVLLGEHLLAPSRPGALVASTIVSSQLLGKIAAARGARHAQTLTGFKWLMRAGEGLVYAYEEALGYCVAPDLVRDKDGISAALTVCELVSKLKADERTLADAFDDLTEEFGAHQGAQISVRVEQVQQIFDTMARLRADPPVETAGITLACSDLKDGDPATDALVWTGEQAGRSIRVVIRPSGTEPKLKAYLEVTASKTPAARQLLERVYTEVRDLL